MAPESTPTVMAQCLDCLYTETLDTTRRGQLVLSAVHFRWSAEQVVRHRCGGRVRLWTGFKEGFRLYGVIVPPA